MSLHYFLNKYNLILSYLSYFLRIITPKRLWTSRNKYTANNPEDTTSRLYKWINNMQDSIIVEAYTLTFQVVRCNIIIIWRCSPTSFSRKVRKKYGAFHRDSTKVNTRRNAWCFSTQITPSGSFKTVNRDAKNARRSHTWWMIHRIDPPAIQLFINWSMTRRSLHEECLTATRPRLVTDDSTDDSDVRRAHERIDHWSHTYTRTHKHWIGVPLDKRWSARTVI